MATILRRLVDPGYAAVVIAFCPLVTALAVTGSSGAKMKHNINLLLMRKDVPQSRTAMQVLENRGERRFDEFYVYD
ncbi:hypothetical protein DFP73DRAFT_233512 [Morchella snyderi]|nr:hypothetical protein DFP73DRAFT_233512 [Morchella snyderi]